MDIWLRNEKSKGFYLIPANILKIPSYAEGSLVVGCPDIPLSSQLLGVLVAESLHVNFPCGQSMSTNKSPALLLQHRITLTGIGSENIPPVNFLRVKADSKMQSCNWLTSYLGGKVNHAMSVHVLTASGMLSWFNC